MTATISTLPIWKKNSTAAEWLEELAGLAREFPERWARVGVVFNEVNENGFAIRTRYFAHGATDNSMLIGMFEEAKLHVYDHMMRRLPDDY